MAITLQSACYYRDVADAVKLLTRTALDLAENHVIELQEAMIEDAVDGLMKQKATSLYSVVAVVDEGGDFPDHNGSSRLSQPILAKFGLYLATRRSTDSNNESTNWNSRHWADRQLLLNAFQGRYLYSSSPDLPWVPPGYAPDGRQLSAWPMQARVEQPPAIKKLPDKSWGISRVTVIIPFRLLLDVPPI